MCKTVCLLEFDTLFYGFMPHICVYAMDLALDFYIWLTSYACIGFGQIFSAEILSIWVIYCIFFGKRYLKYSTIYHAITFIAF